MNDPLSGRTVRIGIAAVAVAAAVLSFSSLRDLAVLTGTSGRLAWLLPIAIDAAAAVSTVIWLRSDRPEVVKLARRLAWSTIALSVVGNGVQHAYVAAAVRPPWGVAVAVGAVAPAILGAVIHLVVVARTVPAGQDAHRDGEQRPTVPATVPPPAEDTTSAVWGPVETVEIAPWDDWDGPVSVPHPAGTIPGWDDPTTDWDDTLVPSQDGRDEPAAPVVPLQVTGQDAHRAGDRPDDDELAALVLTRWDVPPGIGTIASEFSIGKTRAGRIKQMAEDARGTSQDGQRDAVGW